MKFLAFVAIFCLSFPLFGQQSAPEINFQAQTDFFKLPPDLYFGEVAGVAVNSKGYIFVFSRGSTTGPAYGAAAAQLLEFDSDGKFIREIGHHLYAWGFAHAVKVDREDNIWVADKGFGHGHQVQSGRPGVNGLRTQAGGIRRGHWSA